MKGAGETDILKSLLFYCPSAVPSPGLSLNPLCQKSPIWPWTCIRAGAPPEKIGNPPPRDQPTLREAFQCGRLAADLLGSGPRLPQPSLDPARASPPVEQSTRQSQDNRKTTARQSTRQFKTLHKMGISLLAPWTKKNNIILYFLF